MSLQVQFFTFFMMFTSGSILGIMFDVYRVVFKPFRLNRWLVSLLDIGYWCAATVLVFRVLYFSNQGEVRIFIFLGLMLGTWFYFSAISSITVQTVEFLIRLIKRMMHIGIRCVEMLIIRPILILYRLIIIFLGILAALAMFLYKVVVQLFYPFWVIFEKMIKRFF